jgi:hypothetical protein
VEECVTVVSKDKPLLEQEPSWRCHMKVRHFFFVFAICMISFLLPYYAGTAEEQEGPCPKPYIKTISPGAALPGDQLKIRGRRFGTEEGAVVFTPDVEAEIVNWTMHRIWVIVPETATSGSVVVRVSCGSESNTQYFTVKQ